MSMRQIVCFWGVICLCGEYSKVINWSICALPGVPPGAETDGRTSHHFLCGHPSALSTRIHRSRMETMNLWRIFYNVKETISLLSTLILSFPSLTHTHVNAWLTHWKVQKTCYHCCSAIYLQILVLYV